MSKINKSTISEIEKAEDTMNSIFQPYELTDKIIAEVLKNGEKSRDTIMFMLMQHAIDVMKDRDKGLKSLNDMFSDSEKDQN